MLPLGHGVQRDQRVGLGVVGRRAAARLVVGHDPEAGARAAPSRRAHSLTRSTIVAVGEAERGDVVGVHEDHPAAALDAAVAVVEAVDRGVELVVRAQRLQQQPALRARASTSIGLTREDRLARRRSGRSGESRGGCGSTKPPGSVDLLVVRRAARARRGRSGAGSRCSRRGTPPTGCRGGPPRVASASEQTMSTSERRCGDGRLERAARGVHGRHRVLDRDPLRAGRR